MYRILGYNVYTSKKTNKEKLVLHLSTTDKVIDGFAVEKVIVDVERVINYDNICLNTEVVLLYNRFGYIESVEII